MPTLDFDGLLDALRELVGHNVEAHASMFPRGEHMGDGFHEGRATFDVASVNAHVRRLRRSSRVNERWWIELGAADSDDECFVTFTVDRLGLEWAQADETSVSYGHEGLIFTLHRL
jgi:hypothetical protein